MAGKLISILLFIYFIVPNLLSETKRPNILFCIADDWGDHAGIYGDKVVKTPNFDALGKSGIIYDNAYVSSPSCAPSRAAIVTGQWHWCLKEAANLYGPIPMSEPLYTDLLADAGYHVGLTRKGWGPGDYKPRPHNPAGKNYKDFTAFLKDRPEGKPFCFWFGSKDPHRGYVKDSGAKAGIDLDAIELPKVFPDSPEVRGDVADYYFEVQRFDREVGEHVAKLKEIGEYENTLIIVTSDHGMPFPRGKSNLYDLGAKVPFIVHWPSKIKTPNRLKNFISTIDLAPTFLEVAGVEVPQNVVGQSLVPTMAKGYTSDQGRQSILTGKERHVPGQENDNAGGYPSRALRDHKFQLIRNFEVKWYPAGTPNYEKCFIKGGWYGDCDNGPTKSYMVDNKDKDEHHKKLYELAFGFRPEFELYDLGKDPHQMNNLASNPEYAKVLAKMKGELRRQLAEAGDPRITGAPHTFDIDPYLGGSPKHPSLGGKKKKKK
ncbi:MAG: sulfatase [Lentisphaerales bacterium]|nr:sulfatase [Lentisphaerales bacterium]